MPEIRSRMVPRKAGTPKMPYDKRPSVEYTGHGFLMCYDGFGGRWFRASEEWVRTGCNKLIEKNKEDFACYNDLYRYWGITENDFGYTYGWVPEENEQYGRLIEFTFTMCGPGTQVYDLVKENVFYIEPVWDSMPFKDYMEE